MLLSKGDLFMILEFCGGGDLHEYYHTAEFTDGEFVRIASELLSGVAYIHQRKMAHRDLKPANVRQ
jgi:serine/threonine protein kinase